jgi:hypothetical protein
MSPVEALKKAFPRGPVEWDVDLISMADHNNWPSWTRSCINVLVITQRGVSFMPGALGLGIESAYQITPLAELWGGQIVKMQLNNGALVYIERLRNAFERSLDLMSLRSDRAWEGLLGRTILDSASLLPQPETILEKVLPAHLRESGSINPGYLVGLAG